MKLNVRDAADLLSVSTKTIYRWLADGRVPAYRVNNSYRFDRAELLEWASANRLPVLPVVTPVASDTTPLPSFAEALSAGGIHYRVEGAVRDAVLEQAVRMIQIVSEAERSLVFQALRAREELATTAIGDGLALPHLRNPLRFHIDRPSVSLCYLDQPMDWGALDGQPVSILFVIVASTVRAVLQLHARASFALRDPAFRAAVLEQASRQAIHDEAARVSAGFQAIAGRRHP